MEDPHQNPLKSAEILHRAGELLLAEQFYRQAMDEKPGDYSVKFSFATMLNSDGRCEEAKSLFNEILATTPDDVDTLINLGNVYQETGQFADAESCYLRAVEKEPYLPQIHANLGSLHQRQGDFEKAITHHRAAIELDPFETVALNNLGIAYLSLGNSDDAVDSFKAALALDDNLPDAHKNLGNLSMSRGDFPTALQYFERAVQLAPEWPQAIAERGLARKRSGDLDGAVKDFLQACDLDPTLSGGWLGLATAYLELKRLEEAGAALQKAEELSPENPIIAVFQGNLALDLGKKCEALRLFAKACELDPQSPECHLTYGTALIDDKKYKEALAVLHRTLELNPDSAEAANNIGSAYKSLGQHEKALRYFERTIEFGGESAAMAACNMGNVKRELGELESALKSFELALSLDAKLASAHNGTGLVHQMSNRFEEAINSYDKALEIQPEYIEALNNLGVAHMENSNLPKAVEAFNQLLDQVPDMPHAMFNLGTLLQVMDRWDEAIIILTRLVQVEPGNNKTYPYLAHALMQQCSWSNLSAIIARIKQNIIDELKAGGTLSITAFALQSLPGDVSMDLRRKVAENLALEIENSITELRRDIDFPHPRERRHKRLRIGYISPDFRFHSVAVAFKGILFSHDKERFKIYGYALPGGGRPDALTEELAAEFDEFRPLAGLSFKEGAQLIYDDEIDILIDLAGYTRGSQPQFLALRPAPIQVHYLGYSTTLGAKFLDYIITDHYQFHDDETDVLTEQPVFLPHTFMSTQRAPIAVHRPTRADCGLPDEAIVVINFNGHYKFDPELFSLWMRLLRRNPEAVLWLNEGTKGSRKNLRAEAEARGVAPDRLIFAKRVTHPEHLARLPLADLALDNQYHGGGVTTVDCLWMGIPVVTIAGNTPQSRNGATLLGAIGMAELITHSLVDYEKLAADLTADPAKRTDISRRLIENQDTEPLFDSALLTRHLESAFEMMWQNYENGNNPKPISVSSLAS